MARKAKDEMSSVQKIGIGVGLTTAAVAAAGAYFLYGSKDAKKNRKKVKSWMLKAKAEVLEALENAEQITEEEYQALIGGVMKTYGKAQSLTKKELKEFEEEMRGHWNGIMKSGPKRKAKASGKKTAKKTVKKKATKKATKKAAKKSAKKTTPKAAKAARTSKKKAKK